MKRPKLIITLTAAALAALSQSPARSYGQGMPAESREAIHRLFDGHKFIRRDLRLTKTGYEATTESENPEIARAIKKHVAQMSERLESGLMVRRWDPAFAEYVAHYADIEHVFKPTRKGVRVSVAGKTPAAIKVAQNHAKVLADFVSDGWRAHDRRHPAALTGKTEASVGVESKGERGCCRAGGEAEAARGRGTNPAPVKKCCAEKRGKACNIEPAAIPDAR